MTSSAGVVPDDLHDGVMLDAQKCPASKSSPAGVENDSGVRPNVVSSSWYDIAPRCSEGRVGIADGGTARPKRCAPAGSAGESVSKPTVTKRTGEAAANAHRTPLTASFSGMTTGMSFIG